MENILLVINNVDLIKEVKTQLSSKFNMKDSILLISFLEWR